MGNPVQRPQPDIEDPLYQAHFQGLKEQQLRVQQCDACGQLQWPPRDLCKQCHGDRFHWPVMPDQAVVYTYSVVYRAPHPWFKEHLPYAIVVAELENGLRLLGNAFGADVEKIQCGVRVKAHFQLDEDSGVCFLQWVPTTS